jgi:hypothetical protein
MPLNFLMNGLFDRNFAGKLTWGLASCFYLFVVLSLEHSNKTFSLESCRNSRYMTSFTSSVGILICATVAS